jgi:hypothetical protein
MGRDQPGCRTEDVKRQTWRSGRPRRSRRIPRGRSDPGVQSRRGVHGPEQRGSWRRLSPSVLSESMAQGLADVPGEHLEAVIESADECPGECIYITDAGLWRLSPRNCPKRCGRPPKQPLRRSPASPSGGYRLVENGHQATPRPPQRLASTLHGSDALGVHSTETVGFLCIQSLAPWSGPIKPERALGPHVLVPPIVGQPGAKSGLFAVM